MAKQLSAQEARERVEELEKELASIRAVEVDGAHLAWVTSIHANGEVDLDTAGNIVAVRLTSGIERFSVVEP